LFDGPVAVGPPFATLRRDEVRASVAAARCAGLDLITGGKAGERAYTIMVSGLGGGRKKIE